MEAVLEALRRRIEAVPAETGQRRDGMPPFELRFALEGRNTPPTPEAVAEVLGSRHFVLQPLFPAGGDGLDRFALLAFPGVDRRTMPRQALFEIGYALCDALDLISAEPDLDSDHAAEPEAPPAGPQTEGMELAFWCWVNKPAPADREWALRRMGVHEAWQIAPGRGQGVLIAQPDTGVAAHAELDAAPIRLDLSVDVVDGEGEAIDPLLASQGNPGHGTGTASVMISGPGGEVHGSAPGAELVPIRCIESVIIVDGTPVARALGHALRIGAQVVSMSLGGLPSRAVSAAIRALVEDGCIVLAAAGNCVGEVVYPARYPHCIAVAGTDSEDRPWRGSSRGSAVDIAAPGELVWRALRRAPDDPSTHEVTGGQGTSFATALSAGVVALWLSHHGRDVLLAEARRRGVSLQALCRAAMQATAHAPPGWDTGSYGPGILRADRLLQLAPRDIPAAVEAPEETEEEGEERVLRAMTEAAPGLDMRRYGLEAAKLRLDAARLAARPGPMLEAAAAPSPTLARALAAAEGRVETESLVAPALAAPPPPAPPERGKSAAAYLRVLGGSLAGRSLESPAAAVDTVRPEAARLVRSLEKRFEATDRNRDEAPDGETQRLRATVLGDAERVLSVALRDPDRTPMDRRALVALEALVRLKGRPSLIVQNDAFDPEDPELDDNWVEFLALAGERITNLIRATGRVELDGYNMGTGFVVAPGLLMTNRHVLEVIAADPTGRDGWGFRGAAEVDFSAEWGAQARRAFRITGVRFVGPDPIGGQVNLRKLDLALLEVEERNAAGQALPTPVALVGNASAGGGRHDLALVGHPGRPSALPRQEDGRVDPEVVASLERIFRFRYNVKRLALGQVDRRHGTLAGDAQPPWAFGHDATTLGGNSGSALALQGDDGVGGMPVLGLHMGGQWMEQNYAHLLAAVPALRDPGLPLSWVNA
ncbi:S8 family serine peptidase [Sabulicella rubraurantiaca]|uniref:S8 family serine peptidase n=1 Tax=Sabulicella rubraurantiaca TaxID=2811429 RepID=UPI001A957412|nr:S8 family serine peptidase [Sabulicella rubraurantiaca]